LHPSGFRKRFADEMLSIFDHIAGKPAALGLLVDGLLSLARQWVLRPEFQREFSPTPQLAPDGTPSFSTLDPFRPRAGAVIHGLVLSTAVFCMTCFAIRYSWIRVLHVRIPEVQFEVPRSMQDNPSSLAMVGAEKTPALPHSAVNAPERGAPASIPAQNPATQPSAKVPGNPKRKLAQEPAKPGDFQPSPLLLSDSPQQPARQSKPQVATSATNREPVENAKLDAAERQRVIHAAIANLKQYYIDPDVAQKMADALLAHEKSGDDDAVTDGGAFADLLTRQLRDVSADMHLIVVYSRVSLPEHPPRTTPEGLARDRTAMAQENCMFERVQILAHNIGYLKLNFFPDTSVCQSTATAAMASLNHVDAIIFDLRDNTGGFPGMVALIASYLFDHPEYMYNPREAPTQQSWTQSPVPGNRLADKPVYVLTSAKTISGAEEFCYDLKMLKRATLVGETTRGEAHAGVWHRIDDHFGMGITETRAINPFSKTDWEGTGVEPNVKVNVADALVTAEKLAERILQKK
jgi:hypothetical protein